MKLDTFITTTLIQIVQGTVASAEYISSVGGAVSPAYSGVADKHFGVTIADSKPVHGVEFDVALNASTSIDAGNGEEITVVSVAVNSSIEAKNVTEETSSRVRFVVPLQFPTDISSQAAADEKKRQIDRKLRDAMASHSRSVGNGGWMAN